MWKITAFSGDTVITEKYAKEIAGLYDE